MRRPLFTTFHADTPDGERFAQEHCLESLKTLGKCSCLRAKAAHFPGHLPAGEEVALLAQLRRPLATRSKRISPDERILFPVPQSRPCAPVGGTDIPNSQ